MVNSACFHKVTLTRATLSTKNMLLTDCISMFTMIDGEIETTPLAPQALTTITNDYPGLK